MEPKRILVNSDEYKTKGVFLYADDACNLYLDKEFTCAVTGEQLKDYFLLNAVIVHKGVMHLANNLIFGSKSGAKIAAIGTDLVFTSVDFEGEDEVWSLTWDGNTEGLEVTPIDNLYKVSDYVPTPEQLYSGEKILSDDGTAYYYQALENVVIGYEGANGAGTLTPIYCHGTDAASFMILFSKPKLDTGHRLSVYVVFDDSIAQYMPAGIYFYKSETEYVSSLTIAAPQA